MNNYNTIYIACPFCNKQAVIRDNACYAACNNCKLDNYIFLHPNPFIYKIDPEIEEIRIFYDPYTLAIEYTTNSILLLVPDASVASTKEPDVLAPVGADPKR